MRLACGAQNLDPPPVSIGALAHGVLDVGPEPGPAATAVKFHRRSVQRSLAGGTQVLAAGNKVIIEAAFGYRDSARFRLGLSEDRKLNRTQFLSKFFGSNIQMIRAFKDCC